MFGSLIIKFAFIWALDKHPIVPGNVTRIEPTIRYSQVLIPAPKPPKLTVAVSKVTAQGDIKPYVIERIY